MCFDETRVKRKVSFNARREAFEGPNLNMQVAVLRGLTSNVRQPVFCQPDTAMTQETFFPILDAVWAAGFKVKSISAVHLCRPRDKQQEAVEGPWRFSFFLSLLSC